MMCMQFKRTCHRWNPFPIRLSCQHLLTASVALTCVLVVPPGVGAGTIILEDTLHGSTSGTSEGGEFLGNGWRVTDQYDSIYWHIPSTSMGAVEWDVRGLYPDESRPELGDASDLFHMYDYTFHNSDSNYSPGYRGNPYKHLVRKQGNLDLAPNRMKVVYKIGEAFFEEGTAPLDWDPNTTYRFREEWGPDGAGNSLLTLYRNGAQLISQSLPGEYAPTGHSIRIGASTRRAPDSGAPIEAIFSNLKVWDLSSDIGPVVPPSGMVSLHGNSLQDEGGRFLGLGATYMQALRRTKFDRPRYRSDLATLSSAGFNYIRALSMVGWYDYWDGLEIAPQNFQDEQGHTVAGWTDYWQQFRDMIDIAYDEYGLRTQLTIFADAQLMPAESDRIQHMQRVLDNLQGREHKVMLLEVANEAWQNGFSGAGGSAQVRQFGRYLADRTEIPVALTSPPDTSNAGIESLYQGSAADIATVHFDRNRSTLEGGWLPVRDAWRVNATEGIPPVSSNEPIGPGSSVETETDPIKLVSAAAFAWMAGLPMYVYHTAAGVKGTASFESMAGINHFSHLEKILPGDIASWERFDGKQAAAPFVTFSNGQPNKWWTEVSDPSSGVVQHIANIRGDEFYTLPIGIRGDGVELEARTNMTLQVFDPLSGERVMAATPRAGERFTLPQGPEAYLVKGSFADSGAARIDLGAFNSPRGMIHPVGGDGHTLASTIGGREARRNTDPNEDFYFYFSVADWFALEGDQKTLAITLEYFDTDHGSISLQYDSTAGDQLSDFYQHGGDVEMTGTETWLQHTFHVTDAYFGNRQNHGADFRFFGGVGNVYYLDNVQVTPAWTCDFNVDSVCDVADLNRMYAETGHDLVNGVSATGLWKYDLNADDVVNNLDIDEWLASAAVKNGYNSPYVRGDVNSLGGTFPAARNVSLFDYNVLAGFFDPSGSHGPHGWSEGNFDGDADIDLSDYNVLTAHFSFLVGYGPDSHAVPETSGILLLGTGILMVFSRRWWAR